VPLRIFALEVLLISICGPLFYFYSQTVPIDVHYGEMALVLAPGFFINAVPHQLVSAVSLIFVAEIFALRPRQPGWPGRVTSALVAWTF
jgi:hypothetical protein